MVIAFEDNNEENPRMQLIPVIARWNTWFKAAIYPVEHFKYYTSFIINERENEDDTKVLNALSKFIKQCSDLHD
jgi:hypothetical protein